jgi:hypothetical protein
MVPAGSVRTSAVTKGQLRVTEEGRSANEVGKRKWGAAKLPSLLPGFVPSPRYLDKPTYVSSPAGSESGTHRSRRRS